jgi:hypothetical protein
MEDYLEVIYTTESDGQLVARFPLRAFVSADWTSKENLQIALEAKLKGYWMIQPITSPEMFKDKTPPKPLILVKISTCFVSEHLEYPLEKGDWDGKFYYGENGKRIV